MPACRPWQRRDAGPGPSRAGIRNVRPLEHGGRLLPWAKWVGLRQPYTAGLHRLGRPVKHMGRATGDWGPPKRIGALSEITHLRLIAVPAIG